MTTRGQDVWYRDAQIVSVKGDFAWVLVEGTDKESPLKVRIADYVELPEGEYRPGCDWDPTGEETTVDDSTPDGGQAVELRKKGKGDWQVHKKKGHKTRTWTYSIPNVKVEKWVTYHHDKRFIVRWSFAWVSEPRDEPVTYQVKSGNTVLIQGTIPAGKKISKKKRASKYIWTPPSTPITAKISDLNGDTSKGSGGIKVAYTL